MTSKNSKFWQNCPNTSLIKSNQILWYFIYQFTKRSFFKKCAIIQIKSYYKLKSPIGIMGKNLHFINSAASNSKTEFTLPHSSKNTYPFDRMAPSVHKLICKEFLPTWITLKSIKKPLPTFFLVFAILFMLFTALITCIWQHRLSWKIMLYPIFWSRVQACQELLLNSFNIYH